MVTQLQSLDLSWNGLETKGALAVVNALASNKGLTLLNLSSTRMSDHTCPCVAAALTTNSVLEHLMLNGNGITEAGTRTLAQALQINRTLKHLGLMVRNPWNLRHATISTCSTTAFGVCLLPATTKAKQLCWFAFYCTYHV